jgi:hypothetical protein
MVLKRLGQQKLQLIGEYVAVAAASENGPVG